MTVRSWPLPLLAFMSLAPLRAADAPRADLTIYYTHDALGYLESCGCAGPVIGLADLITELTTRRAAAGTPALTLDGGNLSSDQRRGRIVWDALVRGKYDLVGFGPSDLGWTHEYWPVVFEKKLPVLVGPWFDPANNLSKGIAVARWSRKLGDLTVGVTSFGPHTSLVDADFKATLKTLHELRATCDVVVLLSYHELSADRVFIKTGVLGEADLVIGCRGCEILEVPEQVGQTWLLPAAPQGRRFGVVKVTATPADAELAKTGRRKQLAISFESVTPKPTAKPDDPIVRDTQEQLRLEQRLLLAKGIEPDLDAMAKYGYVPSDRCAVCHREAYVAWGRSQHAHALKTLIAKDGLRDECLNCHSEEWRATKHFLTPTMPERGVECITCHGNGLEHLFISRKDTIEPGDTKVCAGCHTKVTDPAFDADKRWEAIKH
jgi:hypothetical protein